MPILRDRGFSAKLGKAANQDDLYLHTGRPFGVRAAAGVAGWQGLAVAGPFYSCKMQSELVRTCSLIQF